MMSEIRPIYKLSLSNHGNILERNNSDTIVKKKTIVVPWRWLFVKMALGAKSSVKNIQ